MQAQKKAYGREEVGIKITLARGPADAAAEAEPGAEVVASGEPSPPPAVPPPAIVVAKLS